MSEQKLIRFVAPKNQHLITSLALSTANKLEAEGRFPKKVPIPGTARRVWLEPALQQWAKQIVRQGRENGSTGE